MRPPLRRLSRAFVLLLLACLPLLAGCRGPAWSPDGKSLAVAAGGALRIFSRETTRFTALPAQGGYVFNPAYSPDGKRLAYLAVRPGPAKQLESCDLWLREVATNQERLVAARIAAVPREGGSGAERLEKAEGLVEAGGFDSGILVTMLRPLLPLAWSPDGTRLAYSRVVEAPGDSAGGPDRPGRAVAIEVLEVATGRTTVLPGPAGARLFPSWSPDGRRLAYAVETDGAPPTPSRVPAPRPLDLYVAAADGSNPRRVWESSRAERLYAFAAPAWSAEGDSLAVLTLPRPTPARGRAPAPTPGEGILPEVDLRLIPLSAGESRVLKRLPTPLAVLSPDLSVLVYNGPEKASATTTALLAAAPPTAAPRVLEAFTTSPRSLALESLDTNQPPSLSPDRRTVAMVVFNRATRQHELWLHDVETGKKSVFPMP